MKKRLGLTILIALLGTTAVFAADPFVAAVRQDGHWGAINGENQKIIQANYDKIGITLERDKNNTDQIAVEDYQKNHALGLLEVQRNGLRGFYNRQGKVIVPVSYDSRSAWVDQVLLVRAHDQYGYYRSDGVEIAKPSYDSAAVFCEGLAGVGKEGRHGFLNSDGHTVVPLSYEEVGLFQDSLATIRKNGKWGVINKNGTEIVPCRYDDMQFGYQDGYIGVKEKDSWGFLDNQGNMAIVPQFKSILSGFHDGFAAVETKDGDVFIDIKGKMVTPPLAEIYTQFNEGLAAVRFKNGTKGYIDTLGKMAFVADYSQLGSYQNGLAEYGQKRLDMKTGGAVAISVGGGNEHTGSPIIIPSLDRDLGVAIGVSDQPYDDWTPYGQHVGRGVNVGAGMVFRNNMKRGYIDRTGKIIVDARLDYVSPMTDQGTFVKNNGHWGYIRHDGSYLVQPEYSEMESDDVLNLFIVENSDDKWGALSRTTGKEVIPCRYEELQAAGTLVKYKKDGLYGLLSPTGQQISPAVYKKIGIAAEDLIPVCQKGTWTYLDMAGQTVITLPTKTSDAGTFSNGYAPIRIDGKWGVINKQGQLTVTPQYEKLEVLP